MHVVLGAEVGKAHVAVPALRPAHHEHRADGRRDARVQAHCQRQVSQRTQSHNVNGVAAASHVPLWDVSEGLGGSHVPPDARARGGDAQARVAQAVLAVPLGRVLVGLGDQRRLGS